VNIFTLLTSLLALNGNQVMDLDYQTFQLGRPPHPELAAYWSATPFRNTNQIQNYAILCATLDWDAARFMPKKRQSPDDSRMFAAQFISVPSSVNQLRFITEYADGWQTNWEAGPVEEGVLKRLCIQDFDAAQVFAGKLLANPKSLRYTQWYHWYLLRTERRKEEAEQFAAENKIERPVQTSTRYPLPSHVPLRLQVVWPRVVRTDTYTYFTGQKTWAPSIIPRQEKSVYIASDWNPPKGEHYNRSWQKGPGWQIIYHRNGDWLVRTATYVERNSHVEGDVKGNNFSEEIVEEPQEPAGYYYRTPTFIVVKH
jgi:hypothetical protein